MIAPSSWAGSQQIRKSQVLAWALFQATDFRIPCCFHQVWFLPVMVRIMPFQQNHFPKNPHHNTIILGIGNWESQMFSSCVIQETFDRYEKEGHCDYQDSEIFECLCGLFVLWCTQDTLQWYGKRKMWRGFLLFTVRWGPI